MHRVSAKYAAIGAVPATDDCWVFSDDDGPVLDRIGGVWAQMDGIRKTLVYSAGSTSSVSIGVDINDSGWVSDSDGSTTVTGGSGTQVFPTEGGWTSDIMRTQFEEGVYDSCEIADEIATFPYEWNGGAYPATNSVPTATHCVYEPSGSTGEVQHDIAMTWSDGISHPELGINLGSTTGYNTSTSISYYYTENGYFCGTNAAPEAGAHDLTGALTSAGTT
jgi:hypothetical protein